MKKRKAISYVRLSTKQQLSGDGARRQQQSIEKYCIENKLELVMSLEDLGVSSFRGANKKANWGIFLDGVKDGSIERGIVLLVENNDRITRQSVVIAMNEFTGLLIAGVEIHLFQQNEIHTLASHEEADYKMFGLVANMMRANSESRVKSTRILAAKASQRKLAQETGKLITRNCPAWLSVSDNDKFAIKSGASKTIKLIFELSKTLGAIRICNHLKECNIKSFTKNQWSVSYVKSILRNKACYGVLVFTNMDECLGYYPSIITKEVFDRARMLEIQEQSINNQAKTVKV